MSAMANPRQLGVDLSHWQGEGGLSAKKWDRLKKCNVRWAILKATQGTGHVDNAFAANLRRARKRGIERGAYHFLVRGSGKAQAQHFIRTVKRANGGNLKNVLLVVDVERDPASGLFPTATNVRSFLREIRRAGKRNTRLAASIANLRTKGVNITTNMSADKQAYYVLNMGLHQRQRLETILHLNMGMLP